MPPSARVRVRLCIVPGANVVEVVWLRWLDWRS